MKLSTNIYFLNSGQYQIIDPALAYTEIMQVQIEGTIFDEVSILSSPGNRQFKYLSEDGSIIFDSNNITDEIRKVKVIYKP